MHRLKHILAALPLLLIVLVASAASRDASDEWDARQYIEKTNRAMFRGHPVAEPSAGNSYIQLSKNRV